MGKTLVQPVVVSHTGTHEDAVSAAAFVAVHAWLESQTDPIWDRWMTESLELQILYCEPDHTDAHSDQAVCSRTIGQTTAYGFKPTPPDQLPTNCRDQANLPRTGKWHRDGVPGIGPAVLLNPTALTTTSDAADVAARALFAWAADLSEFDLLMWADTNYPFAIQAPLRFPDIPSLHTIRDTNHPEPANAIAKVASLRIMRWWATHP